MANARSGGAATNAGDRDPKSATTPTSSASGREYRSLSDRVKKSTISASTASNDSNGVPTSPVATLDKTAKRKIDEHNSTKNKHDASGSGTGPLKQQKRLTTKSYTNLLKTSSEEYEKSHAYEGNASKVHAKDNGSVLRYEESGAHEEDNQAHLSQVANKLTDVEKSAPISEAHMTADLCSQNIVAESCPAMDAREPTDDSSEFTLRVAMGRKANSSKFVEYWVPAHLSRVQLELYCYILLSNSSALQSHSKTDSVGSLRNILVSLRKCCDNPYLVDQTLQASLLKGHPVTDILDIVVRPSGKLLLLDKMLRVIKEKRQRVLILFQSCDGVGYPMGNTLEDFVCHSFGFESYERLDHGFSVPKKHGAMSMFNDMTKGRFIFLIDSRACVPSIKLSSVDVIIIYCSDWNPTNDLRVLQKIGIESQSECVPIFRLYLSCTVEEKALILAKHDHTLDSSVQNITPILSHSLLSWGASFLFSRLEGLENDAYLSKDSAAEELFMDKVLSDYLTKLSTEDDSSTKTSNAAISQAHLSGPFYSRDSVVVGEREVISAPDSDLPKFWVNLLNRKSPRWQYITGPAQGSCRKIQSIEEGKIPSDEAAEASTKRRKIAGILDSSANVLAGEDKDSILPEINTTSSSHQISVDDTWQEQGVENLQDTQKSLHIQLKQEVSKLYELFKLPESSSGEHRRTEHVERQNGVGSQPLPGETDKHLGDAEMEVSTGNGDNTQTDPPYLEPQTVAPVPSQASLEMSKEVEAEANLVMQSAQPIVAPAQLLQREAEQVDRSGITPAQTLQCEMQPSTSREVYTQTDQSAQPSMVPTELSQRDVEQASLSRVPSSQYLPSAMHPPVPLSRILLERTHPDQCQLGHQPEAAPGSSAQLFPEASMMFNHPPVGDDALKNELHTLRLYIDSLNKTHELKQSQFRTACSQEMEKLKQKYDLLHKERDSTHLQQMKTLDMLCEKVLFNHSLADYLRGKFISYPGNQVRAHNPPNHQTPQASQQVPTRPSAVASVASPTALSSAGRPPVLVDHVQRLQVDRPSPSSSPSSQVVRPRPSILNNIARSTSTPFSLAPVLPQGSFGVQSELARAPAPNLWSRLPPQVHSIASANRQQLPTRLESMSARTWSTPVTPINIRQCPQAVPPGNPPQSSLHPSSHPTIPAPLGPSSSHQIQQVPPLPSSSQPTRLPSPVPLIPNPVLPLTSPRGLTTTSNVSSAVSDVLRSRVVGPSASGSPQSDSDSASLDGWLPESLPSDPYGAAASADVVCISDDE